MTHVSAAGKRAVCEAEPAAGKRATHEEAHGWKASVWAHAHCSGILSRIILTVVTLTSKLRDKTLVSRGSWLLLLVASRFVLIVDVRERDRRGRGGKQGITIFTDAWVRARWRVKHIVS